MYSTIFLTIFLLTGTFAFYIDPQYYETPTYALKPSIRHVRETPELHGSTYVNSDKTSGVDLNYPLLQGENHALSSIGGLTFDKDRQMSSVSAGLAYDHAKGHGLSLTDTHIPSFGDKLTAAGHANLFHNDNHDVSANAFLTRNMPNIPDVPNFNTYGGGVDYMYKSKVGASLGVAHTPLLDKTDYSAMGKLNLFKDKTSSIDFNAGVSKSVSPFMRSSSWEPSTGFTFRKYF